MINGFFIWVVFISHMNSYGLELYILDSYIIRRIYDIGQCCVATFFFYSGYGIMSNLHRNNGNQKYAYALIVNRLPRLLLHMSLAVCIYWLLQTCYGNSYVFSKIILSFIGWDSLGNSNWFICVTLIGYILIAMAYWISHRYGENIFLATVTILFIGLICALIHCNKGTYWYNTCLCIPAGMIFFKYRNIFERFVDFTRIPAWLLGGGMVLVTAILYRKIACYPYLNNITAILFALGITLVFACISLKRSPRMLCWCGGAGLFYLYIFQRIPMIIGVNHGLLAYSTLWYQIFSLVCTVILALATSHFFSKMDNIIFKAK